MKNRDWVEFLDTLGHERSLAPMTTVTAGTTGFSQSASFLFVGDQVENGPARELLGKMISAMGLSNSNAKIVRCDQVQSHLQDGHQGWVIALGDDAATIILDSVPSASTMTKQNRGQLMTASFGRMITTHHPLELLKFPDMKKTCWEDLQLVMQDAGLSR